MISMPRSCVGCLLQTWKQSFMVRFLRLPAFYVALLESTACQKGNTLPCFENTLRVIGKRLHIRVVNMPFFVSFFETPLMIPEDASRDHFGAVVFVRWENGNVLISCSSPSNRRHKGCLPIDYGTFSLLTCEPFLTLHFFVPVKIECIT